MYFAYIDQEARLVRVWRQAVPARGRRPHARLRPPRCASCRASGGGAWRRRSWRSCSRGRRRAQQSHPCGAAPVSPNRPGACRVFSGGAPSDARVGRYATHSIPSSCCCCCPTHYFFPHSPLFLCRWAARVSCGRLHLTRTFFFYFKI